MRTFSTALFALGIIASAFADDDAPKPVPQSASFDFETLSKATGIVPLPPSRPTPAIQIADGISRRRARLQRLHVEPAKVRMKGAAFAEKAGLFLDQMAAFLAGERDVPIKNIEEVGRALYAAGCKDPLYLLWMGLAAESLGASGDTWMHNADAVAKKLNGVPNQLLLWTAARRPNKTARLTSTEKEAMIAALTDTLSHESIHSAELDDALADQLIFYHAFANLNLEEEMRKTYEQSQLPKWAKATLIGVLEKDLAWKYRGGGWASTVTPEGFAGFEKHLKIASAKLNEAWKENPNHPKAATTMITVTMGLGGDVAELQRWFHRAIAADFTYEPAYSALLNALMPKWGGSWAHMLAFGEACMDSGRDDTRVPRQFFTALAAIADEVPNWRTVYSEKEIRSRTEKLIARAIALAANDKERAEQLGLAGTYAWLAGDFELASRHMQKGTISFESEAAALIHRVETSITTMLNECHILGGPAKEPFIAARAARDEQKWDDAKAALELAKTKAPSSSAVYLDGQIAVVEFERELVAGRWTKVPLLPRNSGWSRIDGNWSTADGKMRMQGNGKETRIIFEGSIPEKFELRGRFSFSGLQSPPVRTFAVFFGHSSLQSTKDSKSWNTFSLWSARADTGTATAQVRFKAPRPENKKDYLFPNEGSFRLLRTKKGASFFIDDKPVFENAQVPLESTATHPHIGFGSVKSIQGTAVEFSEVEVRRVGEEI